MLNIDMIRIFMEMTHLSEPGMPEHIYDMLIAGDLDRGWESDVSKLLELLTTEQTEDFYKMALLNWLFDIINFGPESWGWYRKSEDDQWRLLPLCYGYTVQVVRQYRIRQLPCSPENILLFLKNGTAYRELLETCKSVCENFINSYKPYQHPEIPINEQVQFVSAIGNKIRYIEEIVTVVR